MVGSVTCICIQIKQMWVNQVFTGGNYQPYTWWLTIRKFTIACSLLRHFSRSQVLGSEVFSDLYKLWYCTEVENKQLSL